MSGLLVLAAIVAVMVCALAGVLLYECHRHERERREAEEAAARMDDPSEEYLSK